MTISEFKTEAAKNAAEAKRLIGNKNSTLVDAKFEVVADDRIAYFRAKAAAVKSEAAKAKWIACAEAWEEAK